MHTNEWKKSLQQQLFDMQDIKYLDFQSKLVPTYTKEHMIGIRMPQLRAFAKKFAKSKAAEAFLQDLPHIYYDENNLHGLLIDQIKDYDLCILEIERFLPYIDNWATCDLIALRAAKGHQDTLIHHIEQWLASGQPYTMRFAIGMLMRYYLEDAFLPIYPEKVAAVSSEAYYVNMMRAWYFATALAKQYDAVLPFLVERRLDPWTHRKTIQKAIESYRITPEQKTFLKTLR